MSGRRRGVLALAVFAVPVIALAQRPPIQEQQPPQQPQQYLRLPPTYQPGTPSTWQPGRPSYPPPGGGPSYQAQPGYQTQPGYQVQQAPPGYQAQPAQPYAPPQPGAPGLTQAPNASPGPAPQAAPQAPGAQPLPDAVPRAEPVNTWLPAGSAKLQALDKVNAQAAMLTVKVGQSASFGSLTITVKSCVVRPPDQPPDAAAYLDVSDSHPDSEGFNGWLLANEPSVSMMQHPIYDLRVTGCA